MIHAQLPDATDPYAPHQVMLGVTLVGTMLTLDVVDKTEDHNTTTVKRREGASITVDAYALVDIIEAMAGNQHNDRIRKRDGFMDENFYSGYESPFKPPAHPTTGEPEARNE